MNEDEAKILYETLRLETRNLHLQAARKEKEMDDALKSWQKICSHEFGKSYSIYGYGHVRECVKCQLEIVN